MSAPRPNPFAVRNELVVVVAYFFTYLGYLFLHQENEILHWLSLVLVPLLIVHLLQRRRGGTIRGCLGSVGLRSDSWKRGLWWAALLGIGLSAAQLVVSNRSAEFLPLVRSGQALYLFPVALAFLLMTAGFTEEFFFRGVIQTRLGTVWHSRVGAVLVTSVLFGLYHIPYAYFNSNWPSHGDWGSAISSAMGQGIVGGLILGAVYERSDRNLIASVVVHSLINALPAMTMIKFGGG
ncbi:MAG: CPBP family intramembrane metalloprotease [Gemmatimonadota bacterium]|nr:CPBP family intramembrane metalloprotease [Gemmatimonadota bacterium]